MIRNPHAMKLEVTTTIVTRTHVTMTENKPTTSTKEKTTRRVLIKLVSLNM